MSSLSAPALISRSAAIPGTSLPTLPGSACRAPKEPSPPRVAVCREPKTVAIDPTNHTIYVTNSGDGTVSVLPRQPVTGDRAAGAATPHTGCPRKRTTADNPSSRPFRRRLPVINCQDQGLRILRTKPGYVPAEAAMHRHIEHAVARVRCAPPGDNEQSAPPRTALRCRPPTQLMCRVRCSTKRPRP